MLEEPWRITLCGALTARQGARSHSRFRTQNTGLLLAYLAYHHEQAHGREELAELLWPDNSQPLHSLRMALSSLRKQMEPPGVAAGSVISATRTHIQIVSASVRSDVGDFRASLKQAARMDSAADKARALTVGLEAVTGELLPGHYAEWALHERRVLAEQIGAALRELVGLLLDQDEGERALPHALRRLHLDPLQEDAHLMLMRVYASLGRPSAALQQFESLVSLFRATLNEMPSAHARAYADFFRGAEERVFVTPRTLDKVHSDCSLPAPLAPSLVPAGKVEAPPSKTLASPAAAPPSPTLPIFLTPFFGREQERQRLYQALAPDQNPDGVIGSDTSGALPARTRLLTLLGLGGAGKTRLALEAARDLAPAFANRVCFAPLADVMESRAIPVSLLTALHIPPIPDKDPLDQVVGALEGSPFLLVLDNLEQIVEESATLLPMLLQRLPQLVILLTSRQRLNVLGEREMMVHPLPTPSHPGTPERLLEFASVQLFVDRAQAARADFQITPHNSNAVAALCEKLEGIPLAIELAAGWAQTLSPGQMLARLSRRFQLLHSKMRGVTHRHQALQACIEWSYRLLSPAAQRFFCQLSVFRGGWNLEAAETVCAAPDALDLLMTLREASFILSEEAQIGDSTEVRYRMLETLREFALEQMAGKEGAELSQRHARWYLSRLEQGNFPQIEQENYRAAHAWSREQPEQNELYFQLVGAMFRFWRTKGWWRDGLASVLEALSRDMSAYPALHARLNQNAGVLSWLLEDYPAAAHYHEQALTLYTTLEDDPGRAHALNSLGCTALKIENFDLAQQYFLQALGLAQRSQNRDMAANVLGNIGYVEMQKGDWQNAQEHMQQCLLTLREMNQPDAWAVQNLAELARAQEQWPQARRIYEESLAKYRLLDETARIAEVLERLGEVAAEEGDIEAAERYDRESRTLFVQLRGG